MRLEMRTLVERASRWLINNRRPPMDSEATVEFFGVVAQQVVSSLPDLLTGREADAFNARRDALVEQGVPEGLAVKVAVLPPAYMVLNIVETAKRDGIDPLEVARVHFALGERLGLSLLVARILALPRDDRWQTMARAALRDDLHTVHAKLTAQVLAGTDADEPVPVRIADWEDRDAVVVSRAVGTLDQICSDEHADLARLSVGLRVVRTLLVGFVTPAGGGAAIEVKSLRKVYGELAAVDDVTFTVASGEFFGILGPNGAGKTTTLEMIEGLRRPDAGRSGCWGSRAGRATRRCCPASVSSCRPPRSSSGSRHGSRSPPSPRCTASRSARPTTGWSGSA